MSAEIHGHFVWYELMTSEPDAAKPFYTSLAGWTTETGEPAGMPYTVFSRGEVATAGMMALPEELSALGVPPNWMPYIAAPDMQATVDKLERLGGSVQRKPWRIEAMDMTLAVVADPQGAAFGLMTPDSRAKGFPAEPEVGDVAWHELATTNYQSAFDFYSELFGWQLTEDHDMGPMGTYRMYGRDGVSWGGMFNKPEEMPVCWVLYLQVAAMEDSLASIKATGGTVLNGPMEVPGGDQIAQCLDPQGAAFAIVLPAAGSASSR